jgi:hypothetical protein
MSEKRLLFEVPLYPDLEKPLVRVFSDCSMEVQNMDDGWEPDGTWYPLAGPLTVELATMVLAWALNHVDEEVEDLQRRVQALEREHHRS